MITTVETFICKCDGENCNIYLSAQNEYYFESGDELLEVIEDEEWVIHDGKHYCSDCAEELGLIHKI
jgi:hypothetical protein